jgi:hypothetical protein
MKAQRGSRGISLLSVTSAPDGSGKLTPRPHHYIPRNDTVPIVQEAGWGTGPIRRGAEHLSSTGTRSPNLQPVTSRYTDCAIPAQYQFFNLCKPKRVGEVCMKRKTKASWRIVVAVRKQTCMRARACVHVGGRARRRVHALTRM